MRRIDDAPSDNDAWRAAAACFDPASTENLDRETARDAAEDLWSAIRALDPDPRDDLPDATWAADQVAYLYFPRRGNVDDRMRAEAAGLENERITLELGPDRGWRFSRQTLGSAAALAQKLAPVAGAAGPAAAGPAAWLERLIPRGLRTSEVLGVRYWQWAALLGLFVVAVVVDLTVRITGGRVMGRMLRGADDTRRELIRRAARPLGLMVGAWLVLTGLGVLGIAGGAGQVLEAAVRVFLVLVGVWAGWRVLDVLAAYVLLRTERTQTKFDDVLVPMFRKGLKLGVLAVGLVAGANALNVDILPLLTGLGIGSLAFAFAAKDTIENFFGSIAVILDRPFEVGDWVAIGDVEGTVEELGFRSTRVRTFYNSQVTVPNATLVRATVDNYGRRQYRRWKTHLGLQYDTTPDQLIAFTEGVRELVRTHPFTRKDYYQVWLHQWSASSMDVLLYVFFDVPDWNTELRERERLFIDIVRLAERLGVQFAFPTQTVHLHRPEDGPSPVPPPPAEPPTSMTDRRSLVTGIRAAQQIIANQPWREAPPGPVTYGQVGPTPIDEAGNAILDPETQARADGTPG